MSKETTKTYSHYTSLYSFDSTFDELNNKKPTEKQWEPDEVDPNIDVMEVTRHMVGRK